MAKVAVHHIPGRFAFERLEDHEVETKAEAERLVATGAFALSKKEADAAAFSSPKATEADESNVKKPPSSEEPVPAPEPSPEE